MWDSDAEAHCERVALTALAPASRPTASTRNSLRAPERSYLFVWSQLKCADSPTHPEPCGPACIPGCIDSAAHPGSACKSPIQTPSSRPQTSGHLFPSIAAPIFSCHSNYHAMDSLGHLRASHRRPASLHPCHRDVHLHHLGVANLRLLVPRSRSSTPSCRRVARSQSPGPATSCCRDP